MATNGTNGSEKPIVGAEPDPDGDDGEVIYRSDDGGIPTVEPRTIVGEPDSGEPSKRRGRPRGSKNSSTKSRKESAADLTGLLLSLHFMGAALTSVPELELEEPEAKKIADAVSRINELYSGIVLPEKPLAWIHLAIACGHVYGPRLIAYNARVKKEKSEGKRPVTIDAQKARVM